MALYIDDSCILCGACDPACPNGAIFDAGDKWNFLKVGESTDEEKILKEGDILSTKFFGEALVEEMREPFSAGVDGADGDEFYFIVPDLCTECKGHHEEPQCAAVCPVDSCIVWEDLKETEEELLERKKMIYG